jgi:hypothetical protein
VVRGSHLMPSDPASHPLQLQAEPGPAVLLCCSHGVRQCCCQPPAAHLGGEKTPTHFLLHLPLSWPRGFGHSGCPPVWPPGAAASLWGVFVSFGIRPPLLATTIPGHTAGLTPLCKLVKSQNPSVSGLG